jgi:fructose-bisphosphate aldolase class I
VPLVKVDLGLADEVDGAQVMKPMPHLDDLCKRAASKGVFGTKMRSVINSANPTGIQAVVDQQFDVAGLDRVPDGQQVMFKLSLPSANNFYKVLIDHPKALRVVALSGGYSRDDACDMLAANHDMIASFSRALSEGLTAQQSDAEFTSTLQATIDEIYAASIT